MTVDVEREVVCDTEIDAADAAHFQSAIDQQVSFAVPSCYPHYALICVYVWCALRVVLVRAVPGRPPHVGHGGRDLA